MVGSTAEKREQRGRDPGLNESAAERRKWVKGFRNLARRRGRVVPGKQTMGILHVYYLFEAILTCIIRFSRNSHLQKRRRTGLRGQGE